ncbi:MAG TPA: enoyl-CoA hydratase-related protein [Solirubrobacterales bacterium]|nr:enoyl-CoA hydratase-related protein [Solirubrobacterales bacterium]
MAPALVATTVDEHGVGLARLDSPETRNALSLEMREQLTSALEAFDADEGVYCIVVAGSDKVFAAGADIKAMAVLEPGEPATPDGGAFWRRLAALETPLIAAVAGYALGGGCELALACDMIVADDGARFGQPEITLGIIPGGGGSQRLTRVLGKQRAMELVLTGRRVDAAEARELGFVNRVVEGEGWLDAALELAGEVAEQPPLAARLAKQAVVAAEETTLSAGLEEERRLYELAMATEDRVEGMKAFLEKREPKFEGK